MSSRMYLLAVTTFRVAVVIKSLGTFLPLVLELPSPLVSNHLSCRPGHEHGRWNKQLFLIPNCWLLSGTALGPGVLF